MRDWRRIPNHGFSWVRLWDLTLSMVMKLRRNRMKKLAGKSSSEKGNPHTLPRKLHHWPRAGEWQALPCLTPEKWKSLGSNSVTCPSQGNMSPPQTQNGSTLLCLLFSKEWAGELRAGGQVESEWVSREQRRAIHLAYPGEQQPLVWKPPENWPQLLRADSSGNSLGMVRTPQTSAQNTSQPLPESRTE